MTNKKQKPKVTFQEIKVKGNQMIDKVREIIEEGNARRILIKKDGRTVMEIPLAVGVGGAAAAIMLAPTLAAIGAFASLVSDIRLVIEREADVTEEIISHTEDTEEESTEEDEQDV